MLNIIKKQYSIKIENILKTQHWTSLSPRRLSYLVHGESHISIHKWLVIVRMYLHQDGVRHVLVVVNLQKSPPGDEGRSGTAHQALPGAHIENLK